MSSKIQWTDNTANPVIGCSKTSPGCANCYAEGMAARLATMPQTSASYGQVITDGRWNGKTVFVKSAFQKVMNAPMGKRMFVGSMTDMFHESVPDEWLDTIFCAMARRFCATFQIVTKRAARMEQYVLGAIERGLTFREGVTGFLPKNIHLIVTVESQEMANERIPHLLRTPAAARGVSVEPALGPVDLTAIHYPDSEDKDSQFLDALRGLSMDDALPGHNSLNWVIWGGESGPNARPAHPDWARSLRDQCQEAGVPFFFKQWGEYHESDDNITAGHGRIDGVFIGNKFLPGYGNIRPDLPASGLNMFRVGKKRAGRLLDGVEWNEFPEASND